MEIWQMKIVIRVIGKTGSEYQASILCIIPCSKVINFVGWSPSQGNIFFLKSDIKWAFLLIILPKAEGRASAHHSLLFRCPCPPWFHRPCCPAINLVKEGKGDRSEGGGSAHDGGYGRLHILQYFSQFTDSQGFLKMLFGYDFNLDSIALI